MARRKLRGLADLVEYDRGRIERAFKHALEEVILDVADRPGLKKSRKVTLEVEVLPFMREATGTLHHTEVRLAIGCKIPGKRTATQAMKVQGSELVYDDLENKDVDQATIDYELEKREGDNGGK